MVWKKLTGGVKRHVLEHRADEVQVIRRLTCLLRRDAEVGAAWREVWSRGGGRRGLDGDPERAKMEQKVNIKVCSH